MAQYVRGGGRLWIQSKYMVWWNSTSDFVMNCLHADSSGVREYGSNLSGVAGDSLSGAWAATSLAIWMAVEMRFFREIPLCALFLLNRYRGRLHALVCLPCGRGGHRIFYSAFGIDQMPTFIDYYPFYLAVYHWLMDSTETVITGVDPLERGEGFRITPQPVTGAVTIEALAPLPAGMRLSVRDIFGRLVDELAPSAPGRWRWSTLASDGRPWPPGTYFLITSKAGCPPPAA